MVPSHLSGSDPSLPCGAQAWGWRGPHALVAILPSLLLSWCPARGGQPWTCTSVLSLPMGIASCSLVVAYGPEDGPRTLTGPRPGRRLDSQLCPNCVFCAHRQRRPSHRSATEKGEQANWGMAGCPVWVGSGTEAPPVFPLSLGLWERPALSGRIVAAL